MRAEIQKVFAAGSGLERVFFPRQSSQIPDRPVLTLVVLPPENTAAEPATQALLNTFTTGHMGRAKIPVTFRDDEELVEMLTSRYGDGGWLWIPNTLHLETLYASENLRDELAANPICQIDPQQVELKFHNGRHQLAFGGK